MEHVLDGKRSVTDTNTTKPITTTTIITALEQLDLTIVPLHRLHRSLSSVTHASTAGNRTSRQARRDVPNHFPHSTFQLSTAMDLAG